MRSEIHVYLHKLYCSCERTNGLQRSAKSEDRTNLGGHVIRDEGLYRSLSILRELKVLFCNRCTVYKKNFLALHYGEKRHFRWKKVESAFTPAMVRNVFTRHGTLEK